MKDIKSIEVYYDERENAWFCRNTFKSGIIGNEEIDAPQSDSQGDIGDRIIEEANYFGIVVEPGQIAFDGLYGEYSNE